MDMTARTIEAADSRAAALAGDTSAIPEGPYCYRRAGAPTQDARGLPVFRVESCPYWASAADKPRQMHGYCAFLKHGDWMEGGVTHLWDQVKECGLNDDDFPEDES